MGCFRHVRVWPGALRVIHWVNALCVLALIPLGLFILASELLEFPEEGVGSLIDVHAAIGFILASGAAARIIYLFTGPPPVNWKDVVPHTKAQMGLLWATLRYYAGGFRGKAPLYLTHNPIAGLFDTLLFIAFVTQAASGTALFAFHEGAEEQIAHSAMGHASGPPEWLEVVHVLGAAYIIFFVLAHFAALAAHDLAERRGLVSSMISGRKFFSEEEAKELEGDMKSKGLGPE
ncbi:putative Ni/Fe-hydrogenase B-type cytochrome subunit [Anaerolineae bacterium]|nr:putative Ni/Fe-hydrogenase B-type cytochrome subunit [Anaerolineae bacterium]